MVIILVFSTAATLAVFTRTVWSLDRFKYRPVDIAHEQAELPSVSVCIAARNETHALAQCLERVLKSDYKKLEVLVLDDSSNDDTSLIIKSFANAGVRFIAGKPLPEDWLGKNHAYQTLIDEASAEYVLFLDVDTTIAPTTISQLMAQLVSNEKSMLSVLPQRFDSQHASAILATFRYHWELLMGTKQSPPASSAMWMIERTALSDAGIGLSNYGMSVRPERHLARQLQRNKNYYYLIGTSSLGVGFEKRLDSQYETARRLYYPMSGRSFLSWFASYLFVLLLLMPIVIIALQPAVPLTIWAIVLAVLMSITTALYSGRTYGHVTRELRIIAWPILLVQELWLLISSFVNYRFGTVTWKGRAVNAQPLHQDDFRLNE